MSKIKLILDMLKEEGSRILGTEITTTDKQINFYGWGDSKKTLKIVVCKGYISDWCIYVESMENNMTFEQVKSFGNKIHSINAIKLLVDCSDEVLQRYRN